MMFCLDFVNRCCTDIQVTSSTFDWVDTYLTIIQKFGDIYSQSYASNSDEQMVIADELPQNILKSPSTSVKQYFSWIQNIHKVMLTWKTELCSHNANYDEICEYTQKQQNIQSIAQHISATGLVVSTEDLKTLKYTFLEKFDELNSLLLKYLPGDSNLGW